MLKERIQKLQNRAARDMTGANYDVRSEGYKGIRRDTNLNNYNLRSDNTNLPVPRTSTEYLKKVLGTVVLSGTPELGEGDRRGSCPSCLLLGGARGAEVPFEL